MLILKQYITLSYYDRLHSIAPLHCSEATTYRWHYDLLAIIEIHQSLQKFH